MENFKDGSHENILSAQMRHVSVSQPDILFYPTIDISQPEILCNPRRDGNKG
jgi:hypothetical protein